jgi:acyl carrier protein
MLAATQRAEARQILVEIFATVLGISETAIKDELSPDNCATWDSLRHIQLCTAIDQSFRITLDITQQVEMLNFGLALDTVLGAMETAVPREG